LVIISSVFKGGHNAPNPPNSKKITVFLEISGQNYGLGPPLGPALF